MAVPSLNTIPVLASLSGRGVYRFQTQSIGTVSGTGATVLAGPQSVIWKWSHCTQTEMDWLLTTMLAGASSLTLTAAELWDHKKDTYNATSGILYLPSYASYRGSFYWDVQIEIGHLLPLVLS